ncbi:MAG: hypothetical protein JOZ90_15505 [Alphaproteobacteria bacterium]|nr:hypothetical protein [Alphaproteobacteria bacterium]MBV9371704.1 hypothetical protein [Alphaproteobacteria bacterium]MBV9902480.1 hypothetical protein [Alphaproteobacteria bacterium]
MSKRTRRLVIPVFVALCPLAFAATDPAAAAGRPDPAAAEARLDRAMARAGELAPDAAHVRIARPAERWLAPGRAALLPPEAVPAARSDDELVVLLLFTAAYSGEAPGTRHDLPAGAKAASAILGAYAEDAAEERDRHDPYLRLPRAAPALGEYPRGTSAERQPPAARALALGVKGNISECRTVALLRRLARSDAAMLREGARRALRDLGTLAYDPAGECPPADES